MIRIYYRVKSSFAPPQKVFMAIFYTSDTRKAIYWFRNGGPDKRQGSFPSRLYEIINIEIINLEEDGYVINME